jgi:hypothetical protein
MNTSPSHLNEDYIFGCFLDYKSALYLARSLDGLLRLKRCLKMEEKVDQRYTDYASSCIRIIFPEVKIPGWSQEEFNNLIESEQQNKSLSKEELQEKIELESEELREKIESGELDIWDDSPKYVDYNECKKFYNEVLELLKKKILPACNPNESFLEALTPKLLDFLSEAPNNESNSKLGAYKALIALWDAGRMFHEGEPPFKIVFSTQVAEQLGIDPILESIRSTNMRPLRKNSYESKRVKAALSICNQTNALENELPNLQEISLKIFKTIEFEA